MSRAGTVSYDGYCTRHRKEMHRSRKAARHDARTIHDPGLRPYRCDAIPGYWHLGHKPAAVMAGTKTAREVYR